VHAGSPMMYRVASEARDVTRTRGPRAWRGPTQFKQKPQAPVLPKHINHPLSTPRHPTPPSPPPHSRLRPRCSTPHPQHRAVCCAVAGRAADSHVGTRGPARPTRHTSPGRFAKKVLHLLPKNKVLFNHRARSSSHPTLLPYRRPLLAPVEQTMRCLLLSSSRARCAM